MNSGTLCRRPHQSLASVGTAALVRLALSTGSRLSPEAWAELLQTLSNSTEATLPDIESLVTTLAEHRTSVDSTDEGLDNSEGPWSIQSPIPKSQGLTQSSPYKDRRVENVIMLAIVLSCLYAMLPANP